LQGSIFGPSGQYYVRGYVSNGTIAQTTTEFVNYTYETIVNQNGQQTQVRYPYTVQYINLFLLTADGLLTELTYLTSTNYKVNIGIPHYTRTWSRISTSTLINSNNCTFNRNLVLNPWQGSFTDYEFGQGRLFLCQNGREVWGVYSELGFIQGTTSANGLTLSGMMYDAGDGKKVAGPFTLTLSSDYNSFVGKWNFQRTPKQSVTWNELRTSVDPPTPLQCLTPYRPVTKPVLTGRYFMINPDVFLINQSLTDGTILYNYLRVPESYNGWLDICYTTVDTFTASYYDPVRQVRGYMTGNVIDNGGSLQMQWYEDHRQGIQFERMTAPGLLQGYRWDWPDIQVSDYWYCSDDDEDDVNTYWYYSGNVTYYQYSTLTTPQDCERNADLIRYAVPSSNFPTLFPPPPIPPVSIVANTTTQITTVIINPVPVTTRTKNVTVIGYTPGSIVPLEDFFKSPAKAVNNNNKKNSAVALSFNSMLLVALLIASVYALV